MKRSILYALLVWCTFSCTSELRETITDNPENFLDQLAQSDEYHHYFTALVETGEALKADPLDVDEAEQLLNEGKDFRTLSEPEVQHIGGAVTYLQVQQRMSGVIKALNARFPEYPNGMSANDRMDMRQRYFAYRGIQPMDFAFLNK